MSTRLADQIKSCNGKLLSIFLTAGFPELDCTLDLCCELEEAGVDMIEIGMPYSDPIADGPAIQAASAQALKNGMSISRLLEQLKALRERVSIPVYLMGYLNPVIQYGIEQFVEQSARVGIDGFIIPDFPIDEYQERYRAFFIEHGVGVNFLVTPQTEEDRIREIEAASHDFIYVVSSPSVTGSQLEVSEQQMSYFQRLSKMNLSLPLIVGFGVNDRKSFQKSTELFQGGIIGSAFIRHLSENGIAQGSSRDFIRTIIEERHDCST